MADNTGSAPKEYVGGGAEYGDDADADDLPMVSNGTADGHADCVPAATSWPAVEK